MTARDQLALAELFSNCFFSDQSTVCESMKNVDWGLVVIFAVTWHSAVNAFITCNGFINVFKTLLSFLAVVLFFYAGHREIDPSAYLYPDQGGCLLHRACRCDDAAPIRRRG